MSNPILNEARFPHEETFITEEPMTIKGTVEKILLLFACLSAGAIITIWYLFSVNPTIVPALMSISAIVGFILAIITTFNVKIAKYTAQPYAFLEGILMGGMAIFFESMYKGIAVQAVVITLAVLFVMLFLYRFRLIRYTETFASVLKTGLLSILVIYLVQMILLIFSQNIPLIFNSGVVGIIFSLVVCGFAAMCFIQDFFFIEESSRRMLPKEYEWYSAFGLMVTVIWLYMEILRFLAKVYSRK